MNIKLIKLKLENFKGINSLEVNFKEKTDIYGENATGKTTIFDAYSWLLWDKDSQNRKDFNIKPFKKNGEVTHNVESLVEGNLEFNGKSVSLRKVYKEIWTKKRGKTTEEFSGHTTDYFINEVPVKKSEYNNKISEMVNEDEFRLLSNPLYFNQVLDKKERRKILLSLISDVTLEDILKANVELKELDLINYSIEEIQAMAKASRKKINDDLKSLPARIDELNNSKVDYDFEKILKDKKDIEKKIKDIDKLLSGSNKSLEIVKEKTTEINNLYREKQSIQNKIDEINANKEFEITREFNKRKLEYESERENARQAYIKLDRERDLKSEEKDIKLQELETLEKGIESLRKNYLELKKSEYDGSLICPTCKRPLEEHDQKEILENFNLNKAKKLEEITKEANRKKDLLEDYKEDIEKLSKYIDSLTDQVLEKDKEYEQFKDFSEDKPEIIKEDYPERFYQIDKEIAQIEKEIKSLEIEDNSHLEDEKNSLQKDLEELNKKLGLKDQNKFIDEKIKLYEEQEKELAAKFEEQEYKLYLCDEYTRIHAELVQDEVNKLFKNVNFKLFEIQINGGIIEACEAKVNGVDYSDVNSAGKINAGLDVINTLSNHIEKKVPIFVDNAESINELIDVDSQIVRLIVSKDKELNIK
ncbi:MAG: AAA family ATPase [Helcococcus sp.]|nr:AAA family ATPase [Helcococcus sp.]